MRRRAFIAGSTLTVAGSSGLAAPKRKVLYLSQSAGFKHGVVNRPAPDQLALSEQVMVELGVKSGAFEVTCSQDAAKDITADNLKQYDAVFFYTTGELPLDAAQKQALLDFIQNGKGFLGTHSATDTFYKWPEYGELIGGYFDGHPWHQKITVKVEDPKFPGCQHLGASFEITDEIYQYRNWDRSKTHVVMSVDNASIDLNKPGVKRADKDFGLAWAHHYGQGRMFYTALGHREEVWKDERFQTLVIEVVKWACDDTRFTVQAKVK